MAYARASRMNDEAAARGSSAAAGGRGLRANTTAARTQTPSAMPVASPAMPAFVMNEPSPGRVYVPPKAVKVSLATRKNQPLLQERIELYTSFGIAAGNASRRNRSMPRRPKLDAAASRSTGIVVRDS